MLKIFNFIFTLLLFSVSSVAHADEPISVPDHLLPVINAEILSVEVLYGIEIYFNPNREEAIDARDRFIRILPEIYRQLDFENVCKRTQLRVFLISDEILNDRDIMSFLKWEHWGNRDIWGAYNRSSNPNYQEIFLSTVTEGDFNNIAAHEFYHRYQDVTCGGGIGRDHTESDAVTFTNRFCVESGYC